MNLQYFASSSRTPRPSRNSVIVNENTVSGAVKGDLARSRAKPAQSLTLPVPPSPRRLRDRGTPIAHRRLMNPAPAGIQRRDRGRGYPAVPVPGMNLPFPPGAEPLGAAPTRPVPRRPS